MGSQRVGHDLATEQQQPPVSLDVTVFGEKRGNKVNKRLLGLGSSPAGLISYTKRKTSLGCRKQGKATGGCRGRRPSASQGERPQEKPTLWALWPQISGLQKYNTVLLFKTPSLWYFITAGGDLNSIPGSGRSSGEENGNWLQYPCLGNPMDRGPWCATVHGIARVGHNFNQPTKQTNTIFYLRNHSP